MELLCGIVDKVSGLRFMVEKLDICSGLGRRYMLSSEFMTSGDLISAELRRVGVLKTFLLNESNKSVFEEIKRKLEQIHDIKGTFKNIASAAILDDVELFEIKRFCLLEAEIKACLDTLEIDIVQLSILESVVDILDPDKQRVSHFYIYSSYSQELDSLRKKHKAALADNDDTAEDIRLKSIEIEDKIRQQLSTQLFEYASVLTEALENIACLDVLIAKASQAIKMNLVEPFVSKNTTKYSELFNPQVRETLQLRGKDFQPVDIDLYESPCLITGANMAGKTVLLKTIALSQYLFQFGFFVPACHAEIVPVDTVLMSLGDEQSELNGLSSFAAEMLNVNDIVMAIKSDKKVLALIDELARTTNPEEGKAIVNAMVDMLGVYNVRSLVTTHYNAIETSCRKLRVKGLVLDKLETTITKDNINDYMDYSLIENVPDIVPMEALRIAAFLGVDSELLDRADKYIEHKK